MNTCRIRTENQLQFRTGRFIISSNGSGNINCTEALSMNGMSKINFGSNGVIGFRTPYRLYDIITESNYVTEKDLETLVPSMKSESGNVDLSKCLTTDSTKFDLTSCTINGKNKLKISGADLELFGDQSFILNSANGIIVYGPTLYDENTGTYYATMKDVYDAIQNVSGGSGSIDWSNINAENISITANSLLTLKSNDDIKFGCNKKLSIDVTNCEFNISNYLNVRAIFQ